MAAPITIMQCVLYNHWWIWNWDCFIEMWEILLLGGKGMWHVKTNSLADVLWVTVFPTANAHSVIRMESNCMPSPIVVIISHWMKLHKNRARSTKVEETEQRGTPHSMKVFFFASAALLHRESWSSVLFYNGIGGEKKFTKWILTGEWTNSI